MMVPAPTFLVIVLHLSCLVLLLLPMMWAVPIELYGLNYNTRQGADWNPNKCETYEQVHRDLTVLRRVTSRIRILSLYDCGQGELVLQIVRELGNLQVWLGLWVSEDATVFDKELSLLEDFIQRGLIDDASGLVLGISVGSEAIYREEVSVDENIEYMNQVKSLLTQYGLDGVIPVSICDIAPTYQYNSRLTDAVDVVITNSFPFWESIPIDGATDYLVTELTPIEAMATSQSKQVMLGETGWPSDGFIEGVGVASEDNQVQYFIDFYCRMGQQLEWQYFYFTGIDNAWRQEQDPNNTIEGNWGFLYETLELKPGFVGLTFTCPSNGIEYSFDETDWTIPDITIPPTISPAPVSTSSCQAHSACAHLGGNCCPADNGLMLGCCDTTETTNTTPTSSPPITSPTGMPLSSDATPEPSIAPITSEPTMTTLSPLSSTTGTPAPLSSETTEPAQEAPTTAPVGSTPTIATTTTTTGEPTTNENDDGDNSPASPSSSTPAMEPTVEEQQQFGTSEPTPTLESLVSQTTSSATTNIHGRIVLVASAAFAMLSFLDVTAL